MSVGETLEDLLGVFGFTSEIMEATVTAYQDPSKDNINAVVKAYAANGQVIPGKLYGWLLQRHDEVYPEESMFNINFGWTILIVGIGAYLFFGRKRR